MGVWIGFILAAVITLALVGTLWYKHHAAAPTTSAPPPAVAVTPAASTLPPFPLADLAAEEAAMMFYSKPTPAPTSGTPAAAS